MFGNYRAINIKQLTDRLLGKPYITVLNPNFNRIGRVVFFSKDEKISRTVTNLQFFSNKKYPLSTLSMPLKNHMESSLIPLFQKVKKVFMSIFPVVIFHIFSKKSRDGKNQKNFLLFNKKNSMF